MSTDERSRASNASPTGYRFASLFEQLYPVGRFGLAHALGLRNYTTGAPAFMDFERRLKELPPLPEHPTMEQVVNAYMSGRANA